MGETIETEQEIWDKLFRPEILETFFDPYPEVNQIEISHFTTPEGPSTETIKIEPFFPFATIDDLKLAIYTQSKKNPAFAPEFQFLAIPFAETITPGQRAKRYVALDFYFKKGPVILYLNEPFKAVTADGWDERFVDSEGNRRLLEGASRGRSCFEDVLIKPTGGKVPPIHLFLLRDLLNAVRLPKPLSIPQYNGRLLSYFPSTTAEMDGTKLTEKQAANIETLNTYFLSKQKIMVEKLSPLLEEFTFSNFAKIKDVKYLRFVWLQKTGKKPLDTLFYEIPVSHARPFLRFYPADNVPINKLQVKGVLPIPDIADPCLLLQWAKEKSPTTERDFLLGKISIQQLFEGSAPLYATLQAVDDGTAAIILEPPKPLKRLDPLTDLKLLKESVQRGIQGFPFAESRVDIDEANMVAILRLPSGQTKMSTKDIYKRFQLFRGFFQEISPLDGENPLLAIRYKAVSNFFREDAVGLYLTELASRHVLNPSTAFDDMINILSEEFSLTKDEARVQFNKWKDTKEEIVPLQPEYDIYKLKYNPGIDILIYAQHPDYFFHLYRVDSYINLRRVLTLLTMMFTIPKEELGIEEKQVKTVEESAAKAVPDVDSADAEGIVGSKALATVGRAKQEAIAVQVEEDTGDVGDAAEISEWDFFDNEQDDSPESVEESISPAKAKTLVKQAQLLPVAVKPGAAAALILPSSKLAIPTANYFIRKLQEADSRLFEYTKGIKGLKKYVSVCAANEHRQPAVLDQAGYDRMMLEYRPDMENDQIDIITYGFEKGEVSLRKTPLPYKTAKEREEHTFMVLKYGTDITNQKYYLCAEYFCLKDEIIVRKDEFEGTVFRKNADPEFVGRRKEPNRCPFCNGRLISNYPEVKEGETVFPREVNITNKIKKHTHIGFYSKRLHPEGFGLPCCFTSPQTIKSTDQWFNPLREMSKKLRRAGAEFDEEGVEEEEEEEDEDEEVASGFKIPNYQDTLQRVYRKYIVGPEKMPLEIGDEPQIGLLPLELNDYFKQNVTELTQRVQIRQELKADAKGFLRIGVDNRGGHRTESFFSAIAPFLRLNSADQVRDLIKSKITPRVFLSANYGNLMMEFFDPRIPERPVLPNEIRDFASKNLQIKRKDQLPYVTRIYKSYINFWGDERATGPHAPSFLDNKSAVKEYRQFASLLAQPNVITPRGIVFMVLDLKDDGSVKVICPPYGYNETMRGADIGILLRKGDIWEPIFYTYNTLPTATKPAIHTIMLRFQKNLEASWPAVLGRRVEEFQTQCKGPDVAQYTGIQMIKRGAKLLNLSIAVKIFAEPYNVHGVIRDTYNHIVACIFKADPDQDDTTLIALPVTDDGVIRSQLQVYLNWDGFTPAPANLVIDFYRKQVNSLLSFYPALAASYRPEYAIIPTKKEKIEAIQLANGIFIPVSPPEEGKAIDLPAPPGGQPQELEWFINKKIMFAEGREYKIDLMKKIESEKQLEEIYEHFRLTFSEWLTGSKEGTALQKDIFTILFPPPSGVGVDLPVFEKRKRLEIILSPFITRWMDSSEPGPKSFESLLRVDCTSIALADKCKSPCIWKIGEKAEGCFIHTPKMEDTGGMNTPDVFLARLIEELIRFPGRRAELLKQNKKHVSHLVNLKSAVRIGDTFVVQEDSAEWADMLRMECRKMAAERAHFFEEVSSSAAPVAELEEAEVIEERSLGALPDQLKALLGGDPKTENLALFEWDKTTVPEGKNIEGIFQALQIPSEIIPISAEKREFTPIELSKLAAALQKGFLQINLDSADPTRVITGWTFGLTNDVYIVVKQGDTLKFLIEKTRGIGPIKEENLPDLFVAKVKALPRRKK
jgi:hypothetical protein